MKKQEKQSETGSLHTLVCITCGNYKFFAADVQIPSEIKCDACGNTVFRTFDTPNESDEAAISALEDSARHAALGDASPQTTRDDLRDLDA